MGAAWFPSTLLLLLVFPYSATSNTDLSSDALALLALKPRIRAETFLNWADDNTSLVCSWTGVTCGSRIRRVVALDLSGMGLNWSVPPEFGNLTFLVYLNLSQNHFSSNLPQQWSRLQRLEVMDLSFNYFIGEIPSWIGLLKELRTLHLDHNKFSGVFPPSLSNVSKLENLTLSSNYITGRIPASVANFSNLMYFDLSSNQIWGVSFPEICSGNSSIRRMDLSYNGLKGEKILSNISACSQLEWISFTGNELNCSIPLDMLSQSSKLRSLDLSQCSLVGVLPRTFGEWKAIEEFDIEYNSVTGTIPTEIGNLTNLRMLRLSSNKFGEIIPHELGRLSNLEDLSLGLNDFWGEFPLDIFNISSLRRFSMLGNQNVTGKVSDMCSRVPNLEEIYLLNNEAFGEMMQSVSNCSRLRVLNLRFCNLVGINPNTIGELRFLEDLQLQDNNLFFESPEQSFFTALTNCGNLRVLDLSRNTLATTLPSTVGNWSISLRLFTCKYCSLRGVFPPGFGNLTKLVNVDLEGNQLEGLIPSTFGKLESLSDLLLRRNQISGVLPDALCDVYTMESIDLSGNRINGSIPACIGNLTAIFGFDMSSNNLDSNLPQSFWRLSNIWNLDLSGNLLTGSLSNDIGNWSLARSVDFSVNRFSGDIPYIVGQMESLMSMSLACNEFEGEIPDSFSSLSRLRRLNLSHNRLSGFIPRAFKKAPNLFSFDVSFNKLSGWIPTDGPFQKFPYTFFESNEGLCGGASQFRVPSCEDLKYGTTYKKVILAVGLVLASAFLVCLVLFLVNKWRSRFGKSDATQSDGNPPLDVAPVRISYHDLLRATGNFSDDRLLGVGAFGSVYKGTLVDGKAVAIKVFDLQMELASRSFDVECQVFRSLRHRNLCKVISVCSNDNFKALVMEYMPNGSLERWV